MEDSALPAKQQPDVLVEAQPILTSTECNKNMLTSSSSTVTELRFGVLVVEMHPYCLEYKLIT